jgi:hypothetical protein
MSSARVAARRSILFSPPDPGSLPASTASITASQSIAAVPVPWWMKHAKSQRSGARGTRAHRSYDRIINDTT